jgi:DNA-binding NtrC family response regulator
MRPWQKASVTGGYAETERDKEARRRGAFSYLKKPYVIHTLGKILQETLAS